MTEKETILREEERRRIREAATDAAAKLPAEALFPNYNHYNDKKFAKGVNKAGILPISCKSGKIYFYLMRPMASGTHDTEPKFQVCKGTRAKKIHNAAGQQEWVDYRPHVKHKVADEDLEDFYINALREGIEEIGLKPENLSRVMEWGRSEFKSETKHTPITMWLYLAELKDPQDFGIPSIYDAKTENCEWLTLPEDADKIRHDHVKILETVAKHFVSSIDQSNNLNR